MAEPTTTADESKPAELVASEMGDSIWVASVILLGILLILGTLVYVWLQIQQVRNGYRIAEFQQQYRELHAVQGKLQLEWTRLQDPSLLEKAAQSRFKLAPPRQDRRMVVHEMTTKGVKPDDPKTP